jgi:hypothetical protein
MRIRKSLQPRVPTPLAATAALVLALTLAAGVGGEFLQDSGEGPGLFGPKQSATESSSKGFRSALFLFRLR